MMSGGRLDSERNQVFQLGVLPGVPKTPAIEHVWEAKDAKNLVSSRSPGFVQGPGK